MKDAWKLNEEGESLPPEYPTQGQLFHTFVMASARGNSKGTPRSIEVHCICGWAFRQTKGIKRTAYKIQMQQLYQQHLRAALDCNSLFATWASERIV